MKSRIFTRTALLAGLLTISPLTLAQLGPPRRPSGPPPPAQQAAPIELTGYWVSIVTEDWRWRMLTAPHGDYASVPLNAAGKKLADSFDPSRYGSDWTTQIDCRAYGAAGVMRMPERLHISWQDAETLKIETDWGEQTRLLHFRKADLPPSGPSAQGSSLAVWQRPQIGNGGAAFARPGPPLPGGKLYVVTDQLTPGFLRRNGVPYGSQTHLQEWFQVFDDPTGKHWLDVTQRVDDPEYLNAPFITSSDFRQEPDASKWSPHACKQQ